MMNKQKLTIYYIAMIFIMLFLHLYFFDDLKVRETDYDFGSWSQEKVDSMVSQYNIKKDNDSLVQLLKGLCWQYKINNDESAQNKIISYGNELLDRAKMNEIDLEKADYDGKLFQVLSIMRELGVK